MLLPVYIAKWPVHVSTHARMLSRCGGDIWQEARAQWQQALRSFTASDDLALLERLQSLLDGQPPREASSSAPAAPVQQPSATNDGSPSVAAPASAAKASRFNHAPQYCFHDLSGPIYSLCTPACPAVPPHIRPYCFNQGYMHVKSFNEAIQQGMVFSSD